MLIRHYFTPATTNPNVLLKPKLPKKPAHSRYPGLFSGLSVQDAKELTQKIHSISCLTTDQEIGLKIWLLLSKTISPSIDSSNSLRLREITLAFVANEISVSLWPLTKNMVHCFSIPKGKHYFYPLTFFLAMLVHSEIMYVIYLFAWTEHVLYI